MFLKSQSTWDYLFVFRFVPGAKPPSWTSSSRRCWTSGGTRSVWDAQTAKRNFLILVMQEMETPIVEMIFTGKDNYIIVVANIVVVVVVVVVTVVIMKMPIHSWFMFTVIYHWFYFTGNWHTKILQYRSLGLDFGIQSSQVTILHFYYWYNWITMTLRFEIEVNALFCWYFKMKSEEVLGSFFLLFFSENAFSKQITLEMNSYQILAFFVRMIVQNVVQESRNCFSME